jgi:hypothetical protein
LLDLFRHETLQYLFRDRVPDGVPSNPVPSARYTLHGTG